MGGIPERTVVGRGVLGGVGDDDDVLEVVVVEQFAHGADAAVHHVARRNCVGAGLGIDQRGLREQRHGAVVVDLTGRGSADRSDRGRCTHTGRRPPRPADPAPPL